MNSPEVRIIDPTAENARRIVELTHYVYEHKVHDGVQIYTQTELDVIADPTSDETVQARLGALETQGNDPLLHYYYGIFDEADTLQGFLKAAIWDDEDEGYFWKDAPPISEYYSETNPVFGSHVIAVAGIARGRGYGKQLFDHMASQRPNSTIKSAIDDRDTYLKEHVVNVRGMKDTGRLGEVALGGQNNLAQLHRLFIARTDANGKVIRQA